MNRIRFGAVCALALTLSAVATGGVATPAQAASCTITTTIRQGSKSADVTCLETRLKELGYSVKGPDTYFGTTTTAAVKAFQKGQRLVVDGIVGPKTGAALGIRGNGSAAKPATVAPTIIETRVIGTSVQGREIIAYRLGTPGGRVVLAVGQTHGDEPKGVDVAKKIRSTPVPAGIDLWVIDTMNPDGFAAGTRQNANKVDLNRNFEHNWGYIPLSNNNGQYSGEKPADQPETRAMQAFIREIKPSITTWWHQDANRVGVSGARKSIPTEFARLVGLTTGSTPCTAGCTGTAGSFTNKNLPSGTSFLVEMPNSRVVTQAVIDLHAKSFRGRGLWPGGPWLVPTRASCRARPSPGVCRPSCVPCRGRVPPSPARS
jgi:murein peptide amidase A